MGDHMTNRGTHDTSKKACTHPHLSEGEHGTERRCASCDDAVYTAAQWADYQAGRGPKLHDLR